MSGEKSSKFKKKNWRRHQEKNGFPVSSNLPIERAFLKVAISESIY